MSYNIKPGMICPEAGDTFAGFVTLSEFERLLTCPELFEVA
jgi:hypothetical protein